MCKKRSVSKIKDKSIGIISLIMLLFLLCLSGCKDENTSGQIAVNEEQPEQEKTFISQMPEWSVENPASENLADILQKNGVAMMVQIRVDNRLGSGVIFGIHNDELLILTAAHVIEDAKEEADVYFRDGYIIGCDKVRISDMADLGILYVDCDEIPQENLQQYLCARVDKRKFDALTKGDGCIAMGCRSGVAAEAYEGKILDTWIYMEDYQQYMIWARAPGKQGMSGGGLFDQEGYLIGILSGVNEEDELAVVPLSFVLAELKINE